MDDSEEIHQLKMKQVVDMIMSSLLILPFMKLNPEGIDKINKRLKKKEYKDKNQDLTSVISHESNQEDFTMEILLENEDSKRRIVIKRDDMISIIEQMKKKITYMTMTLSFENYDCDSDMSMTTTIDHDHDYDKMMMIKMRMTIRAM